MTQRLSQNQNVSEEVFAQKKKYSALNFKVYLHSFAFTQIKLNVACFYLSLLSVLKVRSIDFCQL